MGLDTRRSRSQITGQPVETPSGNRDDRRSVASRFDASVRPHPSATGPTRNSDHHPRSMATWTLTILLISLSVGCTSARQWWRNGFQVGPEFCGVPAETSSDWIESDNSRIQLGQADYSHWWTRFNDPILDELLYCAYVQNLSLKKAGQQIREARAMRGVAAGNLFPQQQQMIGSYSRNEMSDTAFPFGEFPLRRHFDDWVHGFDASWELDVWGRIRRGVEAADAGLNAQIENYDDVLVILQAEVAAAYIQMRTLEQRLRYVQQNLDIQNQALELTEKRFRGGVVGEIDVRQAKAIRATTAALIPTLQENHRQVQNALCILLALPPRDLEEELGGSGSIPDAPTEIVLGIPAELLRRRPDVRRAEFMAATQSARIGIAQAELYPQFALNGNIALNAEEFGELYDWSSITASVGPAFRWNILNYGRIQNNVEAQDARFQQAILDYQNTVLKANKEVEDAIVGYLREQERADILRQAVQELEASLELGLLLYEQGVVDYQRVLDSQRALVVQQDQLADSRGQIALNLVAVYKAIGGGWEARLGPYLDTAADEFPAVFPDVNSIAPAEATPETQPEVPAEEPAETPEAASEAAPEAASEAAPEAASEAAPEATPEPASEAAPEAGSEAAPATTLPEPPSATSQMPMSATLDASASTAPQAAGNPTLNASPVRLPQRSATTTSEAPPLALPPVSPKTATQPATTTSSDDDSNS